MTVPGKSASDSRREISLRAIGTVVCLLINEYFLDLSNALERAGYRTALHADFASALNKPNAAADDSVAFVDTQLLQTQAAFDVATALAAAMPLALLTRSEPGQDEFALNAIPAVAALPFPPDAAVLIASLPFWRARHLHRQSTSSSMRNVVNDIARMQDRFSQSSVQLQKVIDGGKGGHENIVQSLSNALAKTQFQDVMRQRIEQVQAALAQLDDLLRVMADQLVDKAWDPDAMVSLREQLDQQIQRYMMQSQRLVHAGVTGQGVSEQPERPAIELF